MLTLDEINIRLKHVVSDWYECSGQPIEQVVELIKKNRELAKEDWKHIVRSLSDEEILELLEDIMFK